MSRLRTFVPLALLAVISAACGPSIVGGYFAPTAAVVNGEKIPQSLLAEQMRLVSASPQNEKAFVGARGAQNRVEAQRQLLAELIRETVIIQKARSMGIAASDSEIDARVEQASSQYASLEEFESELRKRGLDMEFVRRRLTVQLIVERLRERLGDDVNPTDEEISESYEANRARYDAQAHIAHIQICGDYDPSRGCPAVSDADRSKGREVAERARAGEDFAALAKEFSVDQSTKDRGGDLGWHDLTQGGLAQQFPQIAEAANALPAGGISDPIESPLGVHVIKVIAKGKTFEDAREELRESLLGPRLDEAFNTWLSEQMEAAVVKVNPRIGKFDPNSLQIVPEHPQAANRPVGEG